MKDIPKLGGKNILYSTPSKKNMLNESMDKEAHKTEIIDKIINSAEPNFFKKKGNYYKSKSLDLNIAQLEEIIKHHKPSLKETHLNPIRELNDSSTAEDSSSMRNVSEFIPKSKIYSKLMNMKNNGITGRSLLNLSSSFDRDISKSFTQHKRVNTIAGKNESTKNQEKTITTSSIKKNLFNEINSAYKPMTTFQNYQDSKTNKTISNFNNSCSANVSFTSKSKNIKTNAIPETTRNINNYKRGTCISFKKCTLSTNSSLSNYSIKDLAKLSSMKSSLNSSTLSYPLKGIK